MCFEEFYCFVSYFFERLFLIFLNKFFFFFFINIINLSLFLFISIF